MSAYSGILGIIIIFLAAFSLSNNRKKINLRTILGAFFLQLLFAMFVLYIPMGQKIIGTASDGVVHLISAGNSGVEFVFGDLAKNKVGFIFGISVLCLIVFTSALISVLYYLKIMTVFINSIGYVLHKLLKTSRPESLSASANIFVGITEAPLVVRPFIKHMTSSELFAVMVGGLASVAGSVLVGYAALGMEIKYLIAASFMAAPGGLLMAKIIFPETEKPFQTLKEIHEKEEHPDLPCNVIEAAAEGAATGLHLALNVGAMLIAFIGLVSLADMILSAIGGIFHYPQLSFRLILGTVFSPFAFVIGVPWHESFLVGTFLGSKFIFNEFVAYVELAKHLTTISEKSKTIATFALCGFANIGSIGILIGGLGVLAPNKKKFIAKYAFKATLAGTLSNLMSAAIAGIFTSI